MLRSAPFGQGESPINLAFRAVSEGDKYTLGLRVGKPIIDFNDDNHIVYNVYHSKAEAEEVFTNSVASNQKSLGVSTSVPKGFAYPSLLATVVNVVECYVTIGPIMIVGHSQAPEPTISMPVPDTTKMEKNAIALATAGIDHLQRVMLNQPAPTAIPPTPTVAAFKSGDKASVSVSVGTLRMTPSTSGSLVATLPQGSTLTITGSATLDTSGAVWWPVKSSDGKDGYIEEKSIRINR